MIVDIQPIKDSVFGDSKNYYFYQNKEGKIILFICWIIDPRGEYAKDNNTGFFEEEEKSLREYTLHTKEQELLNTWVERIKRENNILSVSGYGM